jgi:hypothetical protein
MEEKNFKKRPINRDPNRRFSKKIGPEVKTLPTLSSCCMVHLFINRLRRLEEMVCQLTELVSLHSSFFDNERTTKGL